MSVSMAGVMHQIGLIILDNVTGLVRLAGGSHLYCQAIRQSAPDRREAADPLLRLEVGLCLWEMVGGEDNHDTMITGDVGGK